MKGNSFITKVDAYTRLVRVPNLLILALTQYFVRYGIIAPVLASRGFYPQTGDLDFALLVFSTVLLTAAGYIINDYFDIRIDQVNRPEKIVLQKLIPLRRAIWLHYALTIPACIIGIYVSYRVGSYKLGFIQILFALVLWYYSLKYKRVPFVGNFTIAALAALTIIMIWLFEFFAIKQNAFAFTDMIPYFSKINIFVFGYAIFAFLVTMIREMVKDIEDIEGDKSFRCRTLPIVYGIPAIRRVILILSVFTMLLSGFASYKLFMWELELPAWFFAIVIEGLWIYFFMEFFRAKQKKDYHFLSNILKILIVAGVSSMELLYISF
jgi:4-hydroxybenzoate polyprenyltransferase